MSQTMRTCDSTSHAAHRPFADTAVKSKKQSNENYSTISHMRAILLVCAASAWKALPLIPSCEIEFETLNLFRFGR